MRPRGWMGLARNAVDAAARKLQAGSKGSGAFFVENAECRQTGIGDFFLTEREFLSHSRVAYRRIQRGPGGRRRCSARKCQRQPGSPQNRYGFGPSLLTSCATRQRVSHALVALRTQQ
jgi:hypothetical protein